MSLARRQAVISALAWLAISVAFIVLLSRIGVEAFSTEEGRPTRALLAAVILPGYLINFAVMLWTRRGRRAGDIDERDKKVELRATEITATITIMAVYLAGISLYEAHAKTGSVPAGWLYILAYGVVVLVSLVHPLVTLILDCAGKPDA